MKNLFTLCFIILMTTSGFGQTYSSGSITFLDNTSIEGSIRLDYTTQQVFFKENFVEKPYNFSRIQGVTLNKRKLDKLVLNEITYFASPMISGRASLYQIDNSQYLVVKEDGIFRTINTQTEQNTTPGILAVLFNDCNSIRSSLNNVDEYNGSNLRKTVENYNNCDYQPYAPTIREVNNAATFNTDLANFYLGVGGGLSSIRFFDSDDGESIASVQGQLGVIATPSFFGSLQGNLYFSLEANAAFAGNNIFSNVERDVNFKLSSYRLLLGLEYVFQKESTFKPFLGIAVGPTGDYYEGSVDGNDFDISGGNPIVVPKAGLRYQLPNEDHLGLVVSYIASYENDLTFPTENEIIPLVVDVQTITVGINYYF